MKQENTTRDRLLHTAMDLIWRQSYNSVSVDDICKQAKVLKGSFYHFFKSKSDLAVAAFDEYWENDRRPQLDRVFSPQVAPRERLLLYCDQVYLNQKTRLQTIGKVCGCPFSVVGLELSTQDENIRKKAQALTDRVCTYIESAVRDAAREGLVPSEGIPERVRMFYALVAGTLLQARIHNDLERIKLIKPAMLQLLGFQQAAAA